MLCSSATFPGLHVVTRWEQYLASVGMLCSSATLLGLFVVTRWEQYLASLFWLCCFLISKSLFLCCCPGSVGFSFLLLFLARGHDWLSSQISSKDASDYSHHRHITQADWSQQWTDTLKSLPSGQIITEELRCTPLLLWASRLGYRARRRNKHTRSNFLFVELWSQTHQHIQSRKVFYNACSVAMLSACMLMLCSSAQWSSCT